MRILKGLRERFSELRVLTQLTAWNDSRVLFTQTAPLEIRGKLGDAKGGGVYPPVVTERVRKAMKVKGMEGAPLDEDEDEGTTSG